MATDSPAISEFVDITCPKCKKVKFTIEFSDAAYNNDTAQLMGRESYKYAVVTNWTAGRNCPHCQGMPPEQLRSACIHVPEIA
jgi:hypothetical protein